MTVVDLLVLLVGGGGVGALLSAYLTRKSAKDNTEIQLLDRAYAEIKRLDEKIKELEAENNGKDNLIRELREIVDALKKEVELIQRGRDKHARNHE